MNEDTFTIIFDEASDALKSHQLNKALIKIENLLSTVNVWQFNAEFKEISETYKILLDFMAKGSVDPERHSMFLKLIERSCNLVDDMRYAFLEKNSSRFYYEQRRLQTTFHSDWTIDYFVDNIVSKMEECHEIQAVDNDEGHIQKAESELNNMYEEIFAALWTFPRWKQGDYESVCSLFNELHADERAVCISAVTLGLLESFDYERLHFLCTCYDNDDELIKQRALIGIVLALVRHSALIDNYNNVKQLVAVMAEKPHFISDLCNIQMQLFLTLETRNAERRMREEIIPELLKSNRFRATKFGFEEIDMLHTQDDTNPDWKQEEDEKKLNHSIEEIAQMQQEGVDLYMGTFSQLKRYSFFSSIMNWFRPFNLNLPILRNLFQKDNGKVSIALSAFLQSDALCDSDKYSFCFISTLIPQEQREQMEQRIESAISDEDESLIQKISSPDKKDAQAHCRTYLQDLYRFFKLHPRRQDFDDPFVRNLYLMDIPILSALLEDPDLLRKLANFMLKWKYYTNALNLFTKLTALENANGEELQKMGYCCQMEKNYSRAIDYYVKSDILNSDVPWTLRHLAWCYRHIGRTDKALACYLKLEEKDPDDLKLQMRIGECYVELKQYDEAYTRFFKADYLNPKNLQAARAIAWCGFLTNQYEQAERYYKRILEENSIKDDWLNAGHTAWVSGNIPLAVERYKHYLALSREQAQNENLHLDLSIDKSELNKHGITDDDMVMMSDMVG
jgi:tetratricopeptide (TPR) repeat protein